tara:strand:+ start:5593 stop:5985 length:393 start_codon:yes stop_codon:yes gene_type:complete
MTESKTQEIEYGNWRSNTKGWVMLTRSDLVALLREMDGFMDRHYSGERRHCDTVSLQLEVVNYTEEKGLHMSNGINSKFRGRIPETADIRPITSEEFDAWKGRGTDCLSSMTLEEYIAKGSFRTDKEVKE